MNFSKNHILKYLKGELPHYEQHDLEKLMLEDAFLSDAIEGLQQIEDPEKLNEAINELEGSIEISYGKSRSVVPIYRNPLAIAAVISLVIMSVAVTIYLVPDYKERIESMVMAEKDKEQSEIPSSANQEEETSKKEKSQEQLIAFDTSFLDTQEEEPTGFAVTEKIEDQDAASGIEAFEMSDQDLTLVPEEDIFATEDEAAITPNQLIVDTLSEIVSDIGVAGISEQVTEAEDQLVPKDVSQLAAKMAVPAETRGRSVVGLKVVSGTVSSADNQPIPGVNVIVKGSSRGAITDVTGAYRLQLDNEENELEFSFIGFQSTERNVSDGGIHDVVMQSDDSQLSEVVVVGYGAGDERIDETDRFASPINSRTAYNRYLQDNLSYPATAAANNISGSVILEFTVSTDGNISNIEVVTGLGFGCDEEAIRLIQEGPKWRPAIRNGTETEEKVRVAVRFKP